MKLTSDQEHELFRLKQYFLFRIVFGVIDKDTKEFSAYAKSTKHTMNRLYREGHIIFAFGGIDG